MIRPCDYSQTCDTERIHSSDSMKHIPMCNDSDACDTQQITADDRYSGVYHNSNRNTDKLTHTTKKTQGNVNSRVEDCCSFLLCVEDGLAGGDKGRYVAL